MQVKEKKKLILNALAATIREKRGEKSQFMLASENDISTSILSTIERGIKDPQLTTLYRLANAFNISIVDLIASLDAKLPKGFTLLDE